MIPLLTSASVLALRSELERYTREADKMDQEIAELKERSMLRQAIMMEQMRIASLRGQLKKAREKEVTETAPKAELCPIVRPIASDDHAEKAE